MYLIEHRVHNYRARRSFRKEASDRRNPCYKEQALAAIDDGVIITDPQARDNPIIFANAGFTRMTGYEADEVIGRNCRFLQGPDTSEEAKAVIRDGLREARTVRAVLMNYKKDGTPFWNELTLSPVRANNAGRGKVLYFVGVQKDVTERRRIEEARITAERTAADLDSRLASIVDVMSVGFALLDDQSRLVYMNPHGETMLRKPIAELIGQNVWEVFQQNVGSSFWQHYNIVRQKRHETSFEVIYEPLNIWLDVRIEPSKDNGISVFFRDVTEQYHIQQERQNLRTEKETVLQAAICHERKIFQKVLFWQPQENCGFVIARRSCRPHFCLYRTRIQKSF